MHLEVFVNPQGIQCGSVKASEEHIDHDQQVDLPVLHAQGHIFIVILELVAGGIIVGVEHPVIVPNSLFQKVARILVKC